MKFERQRIGEFALRGAAASGSMAGMSDTERAATDLDRTAPAGGLSASTRLTVSGRPSKLTAAGYARATSPEFKARYGDWETCARIEAVRKLKPLTVTLGNILPQRAVEQKFAGFGELENQVDGRKAYIAKNTARKILHHQGFPIGGIIDYLPEIFAKSIPAWSEREISRDGHKDHTSNIKAYHHYIGKFITGGREFYVRFSLREDRVKASGNAVGKNNIHSTFISNVSLYETGNEKPARVRAYSPGVAGSSQITPTDIRLHAWLNSVNPADLKISLDENGEPRLGEVLADSDASPNLARPKRGTPACLNLTGATIIVFYFNLGALPVSGINTSATTPRRRHRHPAVAQRTPSTEPPP